MERFAHDTPRGFIRILLATDGTSRIGCGAHKELILERSLIPMYRTVSDVMTTHVHVASPHASFKVLVRLIEENKVSAIPIIDPQGIPIGIVSETDLLFKERRHELESAEDYLHLRKRSHDRAKAEGTIASEIMSSPAITVPAGTPLSKAAEMMQTTNVRRLVVVDLHGRIAGIVSRSNLLQVLSFGPL